MVKEGREMLKEKASREWGWGKREVCGVVCVASSHTAREVEL
jgi:hypothetical protein